MQILGVNPVGLESGNATISAGRDLPWLQEVATDSIVVEDAWDVTFRDVIILNTDNEKVDVYNLTTYDLEQAANREELKAKLRAVAAAP